MGERVQKAGRALDEKSEKRKPKNASRLGALSLSSHTPVFARPPSASSALAHTGRSPACVSAQHPFTYQRARRRVRGRLKSPNKKEMDRFLAKPGGGQPRPDASTSGKRPLPPGTQTTLRDCAKVVILDRRDDPAEAAAALLPTLTDPAAPPGAQLDALRRLACLRFVDRGLLAGTGVGAAVRRLKRSPDVEVALVREGREARACGVGGGSVGF